MSWSYYGIGRPVAVAEQAKVRLAEQKCREPEETIKQHVSDIIVTALCAYPPNSVVIVSSNGSMAPEENGGFINGVRLEITPQRGFIE